MVFTLIFSLLALFVASLISIASAGVIELTQVSEQQPSAPAFNVETTISPAVVVSPLSDKDFETSDNGEPQTSIISDTRIALAARNSASPTVDSISTISMPPEVASGARESTSEHIGTSSKDVEESVTLASKSLEIYQIRSVQVGATSVDAHLEKRYINLQLALCVGSLPDAYTAAKIGESIE
ncbi:hypothetical protein CMUS01_11098 [Colletotrichum musicola]|uniref:Uncharacterized protein n=1 Tax=Colletotrichum musicola TaxID=2175873 RepID=A0A8H6K0B8_9PEZI|nr:hypothetical protein CMUS01_11098 [Colletotrichum musicola]